ncbi:MAG: hypothetical protein ACOCUJ_02765, partial [Thiohalospira sp.]
MIGHKFRPTLYLLGPLLATALVASCGGNGSSGSSNDDGQEDTNSGDEPIPDVDILSGSWVKQDPDAGSGEPEFRPYSGVTAGDGRIFYWGGGHKSYDGNDIDAYEIVEDRWDQLTEEENTNEVVSWYEPDMSTEVSHAESEIGFSWAGEWVETGRHEDEEERFFGRELDSEEREAIDEIAQIKYSQGGGHEVDIFTPRERPLSKHSYGQTAWHPDRGFCLLKQRLWCYDPQKGDDDDAWEDLAQNPYSEDFNNAEGIHVWNLAYDPDLEKLVTFYGAGYGRSGAYIYDPEDPEGPWVHRPRNYMRADGSWSQVYSAYDPNAEEHIVYAGQQWQRVDLETGEAHEMAQLRDHPDMEGKLEQGSYGPVIRSFSMEWAPELDKALVLVRIEGQLQLWTYDPEANAWERFQLENRGP